jgi:hypothetical protein
VLWKGWRRVFSLKVKIGDDVFEVSGMPIDKFEEVVLMLDRWYAERKPVPEVLHGSIVFGSPEDQPMP